MTVKQSVGSQQPLQFSKEATMNPPPPVVNLDPKLKESLQQVAATIRTLSIDAVQGANSGHPGLPLGCAEIGSYLYGHLLRHNPKNSSWLNRDRFVLSAGHGSAFLYSCLHLSGFDLPLDELKKFRQLHSKTPGHPESTDTDGVETTTGPLGQGIGNAVGHALGAKLLGSRFNTKEHPVIDNKVYCLAGDGCIMEGVSSEACSLAGHLQLDNLVLIYDSNDICLDGPLNECCTEDTALRYRSYGWDVFEVDGHDLDAIHAVFTHLKDHQSAPTMVIAKTKIGKGSPNKEGTHKVHGAPLGEAEVQATKEALGVRIEPFFVDPKIREFFTEKLERDLQNEVEWNRTLESWKDANPDRWAVFQQMQNQELPENIEAQLRELTIESPVAGRKASNATIQKLAEILPDLIGGSADLSCSDSTMIKDGGVVAPGHFNGRNIKYGVREFGMATIANGLSQTEMLVPFIGTFLTFSDYMRNAIRLAALMHQRVIYQFTHDSVFLGEDGPTHQPVEHYAALRAIPNVHVFRPADAAEVKMSWLAALKYQGPSTIILTRQNLPALEGSDRPFAEGVGRGGYVLRKERSAHNFTLVATGSEVSLACEVAEALEAKGKGARVVSMPCCELFDAQDQSYRDEVLGQPSVQHVAIEAGVEQGWHKYVGRDGVVVAMQGFGLSAPAKELYEEFGFTVEKILQRLSL